MRLLTEAMEEEKDEELKVRPQHSAIFSCNSARQDPCEGQQGTTMSCEQHSRNVNVAIKGIPIVENANINIVTNIASQAGEQIEK